MKTRYSFALAALALTFALATPVLAQDVATEGEASATEKMESHNEMMGEGCECSCMQGMHEKMMKMHGESEGMTHDAEGMSHDSDGDAGHDESEGHAEGMDSDEGHAEMMAAHKEMMAGCSCMSGEGDGEMSCKMHGEGEGMDHGEMDHGEMDHDEMDHDADEDESDEGR